MLRTLHILVVVTMTIATASALHWRDRRWAHAEVKGAVPIDVARPVLMIDGEHVVQQISVQDLPRELVNNPKLLRDATLMSDDQENFDIDHQLSVVDGDVILTLQWTHLLKNRGVVNRTSVAVSATMEVMPKKEVVVHHKKKKWYGSTRRWQTVEMHDRGLATEEIAQVSDILEKEAKLRLTELQLQTANNAS